MARIQYFLKPWLSLNKTKCVWDMIIICYLFQRSIERAQWVTLHSTTHGFCDLYVCDVYIHPLLKKFSKYKTYRSTISDIDSIGNDDALQLLLYSGLKSLITPKYFTKKARTGLTLLHKVPIWLQERSFERTFIKLLNPKQKSTDKLAHGGTRGR